jgi:phosphatidylserine/phosphatidylglycerophosphate/cardiolipin synthase-like enzyme
MSERLQENARRHSGVSQVVRPVEVILSNEYSSKAIAFIREAKSEIFICAYAWRWYENEPEIGIQRLNVEIMRAKARGVRVRALVDGYKVFQFVKNLGIDCRYVERSKMLHAKAICTDKKTLILGSHNLTKRANQDNIEMSVAIQDTEAILQFYTYFEKIWTLSNES